MSQQKAELLPDAIEVHIRKQCVVDFLHKVCTAIDNFDCATWADCFADNCRYRMVPRDNYEQALPLCLIDDDRAGLLQRVKLITELWQYEAFREMRLLTNVEVTSDSEDSATAKSNMAVFRITSDGESALHMLARIEDRLVKIREQGWKIQERLVVLESFKVQKNIILPA